MRVTPILAVSAAFALSLGSAGACPYMQTTQAPMTPVASADIQTAIATHDGAVKPAEEKKE